MAKGEECLVDPYPTLDWLEEEDAGQEIPGLMMIQPYMPTMSGKCRTELEAQISKLSYPELRSSFQVLG